MIKYSPFSILISLFLYHYFSFSVALSIATFILTTLLLELLFDPLEIINNQLPETTKISNPQPARGWFRLASSTEIKQNKVFSTTLFDEKLVLWRSEEGIKCINSYCVHLGADLSQGKVEQGCLECPFHKWKFRGDGTVHSIPAFNGTQQPSLVTNKEKVSSPLQVKEMDGSVYVWQDPFREKVDPWELSSPIFKTSLSKKNFFYHASSVHYLSTSLSELAENGADVSHLSCVHEQTGIPFLTYQWEGSWQQSEEKDKHYLGVIKQAIHIRFFGVEICPPVRIQTFQIGLGVVFVHQETPLGEMVLVHTSTPISKYHIKCEMRLYCNWKMPRVFAKMFMLLTLYQFEGDVKIWNKKRLLEKPLLVSKEDRLISTFRRWKNQFFTPPIENQVCSNKNLLEW